MTVVLVLVTVELAILYCTTASLTFQYILIGTVTNIGRDTVHVILNVLYGNTSGTEYTIGAVTTVMFGSIKN